MQSKLTEITYEVHIQPGEVLTLPRESVEILGPGHWTVSNRPVDEDSPRNHAAFLNSYAPGDEGLYDDYQAR
jgi:hypothetical protein